MTLPRFTDLRGMADDLGDDPAYRKVARTIRKAAVAQSCASDLTQVATCCVALDALLASPRKAGTIERGATENALLINGVLFYARATSTNGSFGERGSISISAKLSAEQLEDHKAIIDVRNRSVAHVYTGAVVGDDIWHRDKLFLVETDEGWKPAAVTRSFQFHRLTLDRLRRQAPVARDIIIERFHAHINKLMAVLRTNPVPIALFEANQFDPVEFFESERAVLNALAGLPFGGASGLM